jgi:SH3-like domain-containing protein
MINENMAAKSDKSVKTAKSAKSAKPVKIDLKGVVFCKAKKCMNSLYKNESSSFKGYCQDCG